MTATKVNTAKLQQAIAEFGSLQKAIEVLELRKKEIETESLTLSRDLEIKKKARAKYSNDLNQFDSSIKERTEKLNDILININRYSNQYRLFESFIAMMLTSPHTEEQLEELASIILVWSKLVWRSDLLPEKMRLLFVETVLGRYLRCYRCDRCGAKFIVNRKPQSDIIGYTCPVCGFSFSVKVDDSFLEAMLGSYKNIDADNL